MHLVGIEVTLHLYHAASLKGKRRIIKSILEHTRHRYHISTAEVGEQDHLGRSILGFGIVSNDFQNAKRILQKVINYIDELSEVEIIEINWLEV